MYLIHLGEKDIVKASYMFSLWKENFLFMPFFSPPFIHLLHYFSLPRWESVLVSGNVWATWEIRSKQKETQHLFPWGSWPRGQGRKEYNNYSYVCWRRVCISAFTHFSGSTFPLSQWTNLPAWLSDPQISTGSACYGEEVTQQAIAKRGVADSAPRQCRTGRLGWFYYPNQAMRLEFS